MLMVACQLASGQRHPKKEQGMVMSACQHRMCGLLENRAKRVAAAAKSSGQTQTMALLKNRCS